MRVFVGLGLISYSAYLWHQPIFALVRHRAIDHVGDPQLLGLAVLSLFLAWLTWRIVEVPFRQRDRFSRTQCFSSAVIFVVLAVGVGYWGHHSEGFPGRLSETARSLHITRVHEKLLRDAGCTLTPEGLTVTNCARGDAEGPIRVALVGDSHAQALVHELTKMAKESHMALLPFVRSSCSLNFFISPLVGNNQLRECAAYQAAILKAVDTLPIDAYLVFTRWDVPGSYSPDSKTRHLFDEHIRSVERLVATGRTVLLIYPIPSYDIFVSDYMAKNEMFYDSKLKMIEGDRSAFQRRVSYFVERYDALGQAPNLLRLKASELFCGVEFEERCVTQRGGVPLYYDDDHLSNAGARLVVNRVATILSETPALKNTWLQ
jgi:hypothetical protein